MTLEIFKTVLKKQNKAYYTLSDSRLTKEAVSEIIDLFPSSAKCCLFIKYADRCAKSPDFVLTPVIHKRMKKDWNGM
jgi:hypothetical protein